MEKAKFIEETEKFCFFQLLESSEKDKRIIIRKYKYSIFDEEILKKLVLNQEVWISYFELDDSYYLFNLLLKRPDQKAEFIFNFIFQCELNRLSIEAIQERQLPKLQTQIEKILSKKQDNSLIKHTNILILIALVVVIGYLLIKN